jgi:hypothetical protein
MRTALFALALALFTAPLLDAGEAGRPSFINARVSAKEICLNESVRIEFTTMPREIEGIDIAQSVSNSLRLGAATSWRLLGEPLVSENLRGAPTPADGDKAVKERPRPITVTLTLLPRATGDLNLPDIPITWLQGNTLARFTLVTVKPNIMVAGSIRELPKETSGVGGFAWSTTLDEARTRVGADKLKRDGERTIITPQPHLALIYSGGALGEATLRAPGLNLEQARASFLQRWGIPQQEDPTSLTWIMGWTRITAKPEADGIVLSLVREDVQAQLARSQVATDVFGVLDGPKESPAAAEERKAREVEAELNRQPVPQR